METGSPIKNFIEQVRKQTEAGLGEWELNNPIELELSTIVSGKVGAGLDIQVINFGASVKAEEIQKIKMSISPKNGVLEARKKVDIQEANFKEELAKRRVDTLKKGMHPFREEIKQ